jgi:DNA-binding NarL/FixJ family response regulator
LSLELNGRYDIQSVAKEPDLEHSLVTLHPDILLLDLSMPRLGGVNALPAIQKLSRSTKILLLTNHWSAREEAAALKMGAKGYCKKSTSSTLLGKAVDKVREGQIWADRKVVPALIEELAIRTDKISNQSHKEQNS